MPVSQSSSGLASLFSWSSSSQCTSLLATPASYASTPYLLHYLLTIETKLEDTTGINRQIGSNSIPTHFIFYFLGFWRGLCGALNNPKYSLETGVKKAATGAKYRCSPAFLSIYRWGQLALELPPDHELGLSAWGHFFARYFHRPLKDLGAGHTAQVDPYPKTHSISRYILSMISHKPFLQL